WSATSRTAAIRASSSGSTCPPRPMTLPAPNPNCLRPSNTSAPSPSELRSRKHKHIGVKVTDNDTRSHDGRWSPGIRSNASDRRPVKIDTREKPRSGLWPNATASRLAELLLDRGDVGHVLWAARRLLVGHKIVGRKKGHPLAADLYLYAPFPTGVELHAIHLGQDVDPLRRIPELDDHAFLHEGGGGKPQEIKPEVLQR